MTTLTIQIPENKIDILSALKTLLRPFQDISLQIEKKYIDDTIFTEDDKKAWKTAQEELKRGETISSDSLREKFLKKGYAV